jgi:hypothetical protein
MTYDPSNKGDYMIEQTMARMSRVEAVLAEARSTWAKQHWSIVLEQLRRELKRQVQKGMQ